MKSKHLIYLYFLFVVCELLGDYAFNSFGQPYGIWFFKPLLMPVLMFWYYKQTKLKTSFDKIILVSLFFSWWGDNFLMPAIFKTDINFLLGLASFLIAHLLYVAGFVKTNISKPALLKKKPYLVLPFILFGVGLIAYLSNVNHPSFREMKIPVIIYASVIMIMVISALNRKNRVINQSFKLVYIGALLFMVSDSFIALSRFTYQFENNDFIARLSIMVLYTVGQYLIAKGCVLQNHKISA